MPTSPLLVRPRASDGAVHDITPAGAGWSHVGFALQRLASGKGAAGVTGAREALLVVVEGHARIEAGDVDFGECGNRASVFERVPPDAVYAPPGTTWSVRACDDGCTVAVCTAPARGGAQGKPAAKLARATPVTRGTGTNERTIHPIAMEEADVAESLLVTEVHTPAGHWSSYPPHRHDEDDFPRMTLLEETYWHRLDPATGFGVQRVFTEDGSLDETVAVSDGDVVLVPRGHHPCAAPHGIDMYYLNVMAGPRRAWRFALHPDWEAMA